MSISIDLRNVFGVVSENQIFSMESELREAAKKLKDGRGEGNDFLGWLRLPENYDREEFERIKSAAKKIQGNSDVLVVIGIGGSYLGARAVIEFLKSPNYNLLNKDTPDIYFVGNNLSADYFNEIVSIIGDRDFSVNVISKSGTTTESAIAFRLFKALTEKKYGIDGARERIYVTTDKTKGALRKLADTNGYECFEIADNIGGRFSVLTAVGLLPIAVSGIDIDELMAGAYNAMEELSVDSMDNIAWRYAAARNLLLRKGKTVETLACYEPAFHSMSQWWKQLFGESEGKDGKGVFPVSVDFTNDLHSVGQFIQEGNPIMFETVVNIKKTKTSLVIESDDENTDGLNFLANRTLSYVNNRAMNGTILAHVDGGVANIVINMDEICESDLGYLLYFFEFACGLSGYILGVNPFNQPGVEAYKKNMFALLGKPGYEDLKSKLEERLL